MATMLLWTHRSKQSPCTRALRICMTRQKCKSTGKRHIARARSEQCTLPLQANMQHLAELPQRGDADLSLARRQDMKVPHGQPRRQQPTMTRKRDAPTSHPWTRCRCCRRSRQRPGCATGPSRWGPLMLPFGLGSKAHLSCGRPQTSEVMAVKLDSFTEAGGRGLQGGSAGKPRQASSPSSSRSAPPRPRARMAEMTWFSGLKGLEWSEIPQQSLLRLDLKKNLCC